jgi:hypothetical protein
MPKSTINQWPYWFFWDGGDAGAMETQGVDGDTRRVNGDIANCLSELENTGKLVFSVTVRCSSFQVRVTAPAE